MKIILKPLDKTIFMSKIVIRLREQIPFSRQESGAAFPINLS